MLEPTILWAIVALMVWLMVIWIDHIVRFDWLGGIYG